jgi:hypothetical protein
MNDNVLQFGAPKSKGTVAEETGDKFPENNYVIEDIDGKEFFARGFMVFTPHHCAIMADFGMGAVPLLVVPLVRVKVAEMATDEEDEAVA